MISDTVIPCITKLMTKSDWNPSSDSIFLTVCGFVCLSVCLSVRLSVCPSVRLSVRLSVCPSVRPSVCLSACLSICLFVCMSVRLSACLSVCVPRFIGLYLSSYWTNFDRCVWNLYENFMKTGTLIVLLQWKTWWKLGFYYLYPLGFHQGFLTTTMTAT